MKMIEKGDCIIAIHKESGEVVELRVWWVSATRCEAVTLDRVDFKFQRKVNGDGTLITYPKDKYTNYVFALK